MSHTEAGCATAHILEYGILNFHAGRAGYCLSLWTKSKCQITSTISLTKGRKGTFRAYFFPRVLRQRNRVVSLMCTSEIFPLLFQKERLYSDLRKPQFSYIGYQRLGVEPFVFAVSRKTAASCATVHR